VVCSRRSGCGTASDWEYPTHTVQACSPMCQGAGRFHYDGAILKQHSGTITYMEDYLDTFHKMKDIFLEFPVTKGISMKIDELRRELRHDMPSTRELIAVFKRRCICDAEREEETEQCMNLILCESHFNFIKMHLLSHFCDHIRQFGNIPMYSTKFGELAPKTQIKAGWWQSNTNDASRQIMQSYSGQHGIRIRLLNLESL